MAKARGKDDDDDDDRPPIPTVDPGPIAIGSVVMLKSGSPRLTVVEMTATVVTAVGFGREDAQIELAAPAAAFVHLKA